MKNPKAQTEVALRIGPAALEHLPAITQIYNQAILKTTATFDTTPKTLQEQEVWFAHHEPKYPVLVAEQNGSVVGWASLSRWSDRCAYSHTAEVSLYVSEEHQGQGIGKKLLQAIMGEGQKAGLHTVIARMAQDGEASINLHRSMGFEHIGTMKEVGRKFGRLLDVHLMQKIYQKAKPRHNAAQAEKQT